MADVYVDQDSVCTSLMWYNFTKLRASMPEEVRIIYSQMVTQIDMGEYLLTWHESLPSSGFEAQSCVSFISLHCAHFGGPLRR